MKKTILALCTLLFAIPSFSFDANNRYHRAAKKAAIKYLEIEMSISQVNEEILKSGWISILEAQPKNQVLNVYVGIKNQWGTKLDNVLYAVFDGLDAHIVSDADSMDEDFPSDGLEKLVISKSVPFNKK